MVNTCVCTKRMQVAAGYAPAVWTSQSTAEKGTDMKGTDMKGTAENGTAEKGTAQGGFERKQRHCWGKREELRMVLLREG